MDDRRHCSNFSIGSPSLPTISAYSLSSGKKLNAMYFAAWQAGLKTTYYLRTLAATQVEKSTVDVNKFGIQPRWMKSKSASGDIAVARNQGPASGATCDIMDPDCDACQ